MSQLPELTPASVRQWVRDLNTTNIRDVGPAVQTLLLALCEDYSLPANKRFEIMNLVDSTVRYLVNKILAQLSPGDGRERAIERLASSLCRAAANIYIMSADGLAASRNPLHRRHVAHARIAAVHYLGQEYLCSSLIYIAPVQGFWRDANQLLWSSLHNGRGMKKVRAAYTGLALLSLSDPRRIPRTHLHKALDLMVELPLDRVVYRTNAGDAGCFVTRNDMPPGQGRIPGDALTIDLSAFFASLPSGIEKQHIIVRTLVRRLKTPWAKKDQRTERSATVNEVNGWLGVSHIHTRLNKNKASEETESSGDGTKAQLSIVEAPNERVPMAMQFKADEEPVRLSLVDQSDGGIGVRCISGSSPSLQVGEVIAIPWRRDKLRIGTIVWMSQDNGINFGIQWLLDDPRPVFIAGGGSDPIIALLGRCRVGGGSDALVYGSSSSENPRECCVTEGKTVRNAQTTVVQVTGLVRTLAVDWMPGPGVTPVDFTEVWASLGHSTSSSTNGQPDEARGQEVPA